MNTAYCYECKDSFDICSEKEQKLYDSTAMCPSCRDKVIGECSETEYQRQRMLATLERVSLYIENINKYLRSEIKTMLEEIK